VLCLAIAGRRRAGHRAAQRDRRLRLGADPAGAIPVVEVTIGGKGPTSSRSTPARRARADQHRARRGARLPKVGEVGTPAPGGTVAIRAGLRGAEFRSAR
jgi:hypothetical protein